MAVSTRIARTGTTVISEDTTFGTPLTSSSGAWTRIYPSGDGILNMDQQSLARTDQRYTRFNNIAPVRGLRDGSATLPMYLRPAAQILSSSVTGSQSPLFKMLEGGFGGYLMSSGSVVSSYTNSTAFDVSSSAGMLKNSWVAVELDDGTFHTTKITDISTNTLTIEPPFPSTTSGGKKVYGAETAYVSEDISKTFSVAHVMQNQSDSRFLLASCLLNPTLQFQRGQLAGVTFELKAATHLDPGELNTGAYAFSVTSSLPDPMGVPLVGGRAFSNIVPASSAYDNTNTEIRSLSLTFNLGNQFIEAMSGVEGKTGIARIPAAAGAVKLSVTMRYDPSTYTGYNQDFTYKFVHYLKSAENRLVGFEIPAMAMTSKAKVTSDNGLAVMQFEFESVESDALANASLGDPQTDALRLGQSQFQLFAI